MRQSWEGEGHILESVGDTNGGLSVRERSDC